MGSLVAKLRRSNTRNKGIQISLEASASNSGHIGPITSSLGDLFDAKTPNGVIIQLNRVELSKGFKYLERPGPNSNLKKLLKQILGEIISQCILIERRNKRPRRVSGRRCLEAVQPDLRDLVHQLARNRSTRFIQNISFYLGLVVRIVLEVEGHSTRVVTQVISLSYTFTQTYIENFFWRLVIVS